VSWGAIFGGATIAIATMLVLETLGVAIGATTIDPGGASPSPKTLGIGAGIWWLLSGVLAVFVGSWVAARLAGVRRQMEGPLHGLVAWGVTAIATMVIMTTMVAMLISGAFRVAGTTARIAGNTAMVAGEHTNAFAKQMVPGQLDPDIAWDEVWQEAQAILQETKAKALEPEEIRQELKAAADDLRRADLEAALAKLSRRARSVASAADRTAAVNVLMARTGMTEEEAKVTVDRWANAMEDAWARTAAAAGRVPKMAVAAADKTVDAVSIAAWWLFFYLFLTGGAAALGGYLGAPRPRSSASMSSQVASSASRTMSEKPSPPPPESSTES
jgi:hypothetical protein